MQERKALKEKVYATLKLTADTTKRRRFMQWAEKVLYETKFVPYESFTEAANRIAQDWEDFLEGDMIDLVFEFESGYKNRSDEYIEANLGYIAEKCEKHKGEMS